MVFMDFKRAFDSVHRGLFNNIMKAYDIPEILAELVAEIYTGTMAKVITARRSKLLPDRLEIAAQIVGQVMNCSKTKFMTLDISEE